MARSRWRVRFAPIIEAVLRENEGKSKREIDAALRVAWTDGPRKYHPYRIWRDEVRIQLGLKRRDVKTIRKSTARQLEEMPFLLGYPTPRTNEEWQVFADWLEASGHDDDAAFVRGATLKATEED